MTPDYCSASDLLRIVMLLAFNKVEVRINLKYEMARISLSYSFNKELGCKFPKNRVKSGITSLIVFNWLAYNVTIPTS